MRDIDATGIAYNHNGKLRIYKRPIPAHLMRFNVPDGASSVMEHTRMTTQGRAPKPCPEFEAVVSQWKSGRISEVETMRQLGMKKTTFYRRINESKYTHRARKTVKIRAL